MVPIPHDQSRWEHELTERHQVLGELVAAAQAPRNGQAIAINARIRRYELRYEMSSERLLAARDNLENGH